MNRNTHIILLFALTLPLSINPIVKAGTIVDQQTPNQQNTFKDVTLQDRILKIQAIQPFLISQFLENDPTNNTPPFSVFPTLENEQKKYTPPVSLPPTPENEQKKYTPPVSLPPTLENKATNYKPPSQNVTRNNSATVNPMTALPKRNNSTSGRKSLSDLLSSFSGSNRNNNSSQGALITDNDLQSDRYRVIVEIKNDSQQEKVRSIYPEAFSTVYNGRSIVQIGVFDSRENASLALETLKNNGLTGMVLRI
jgi:hypothetical protein